MERIKHLGQVFTPEEIARPLAHWAIRNKTDLLLDPSCGDGRFLVHHAASTGIEVDQENAILAKKLVPTASIHNEDFFTWAATTSCRFDAAVGNPPFIRYQHFFGETRRTAIELAKVQGAIINGLASSWAPFLVVTAALLKLGGRMAFVVPAEIGHAPYSSPVLNFLCARFKKVRIVAFREKLFPDLSESAWLLFADGFGDKTDEIELSILDRFRSFSWKSRPTKYVALSSWHDSGCRLRKFILSESALQTYNSSVDKPSVKLLGEVAQPSIGYVSGANEFFHLRPSEVKRYGIPSECLRVSIRRSRQLPKECVDDQAVKGWIAGDEPVMLLKLDDKQDIPEAVLSYLNSEHGITIRTRYKCRSRRPWYAIPDVRSPDAFLSYMSGRKPSFIRNDAGCVCTNSLHGIYMKNGYSVQAVQRAWSHPLVDLSCELEGHPLGGGMLKLEPSEASQIMVPFKANEFTLSENRIFREAVAEIRAWRDYD